MKIVKRLLVVLVGLIVCLAVAVLVGWNRELRTIASVHQVDGDGYLYEMDYYSEYDLDDIIAHDIDQNAKLLEYALTRISKGLYKPHVEKAGGDFSCTSFQVPDKDGDGYLFGRNYDFFKNPTLVVHNHPKRGYSSLSVCDMAHFGYGLDTLPNSFVNSVSCLAAVYAPMDGINEKGVCVSIMALPNQASRQNDPLKHTVGTTIIMRLILDRCATVSEAIDLVNSVNVRHDNTGSNSGYHYMVADANGDCCVIEFDKDDNWKTLIVRKPEDAKYMHVTNHLLNPKHYTTIPDEAVGNPHSRSWWRYATVADYMSGHDACLSSEEAQECLAIVHWKDLVWDNGMVEDTQYSNVYNQSDLTLALRPWNDYDTTYNFSL